ncbi:preprotein translocase subunit SecG [candidate division KSB1 bacterium]|nr:preprotein translocase subunit SecG [candidate division KSB1 bacterium]
MYSFLIIIHVLVCIVLTIVILLQSSKGGGLAGVFGGGGGGMGAVFGGRGAASFLSKLTTVLAIVFMGISLLLGMITRGGDAEQSIVGQERSRGGVSSPADVLPTVPTEEQPMQEGAVPTPAPEQQQEENTSQE